MPLPSSRPTRRRRDRGQAAKQASEKVLDVWACDLLGVLGNLDGCGDCGDGCDAPFLLGLFTVGFAALRTVPNHPETPRGLLAGFCWRRVRAYQLYVSARRPSCCPMTPTCSRYALDALRQHGTARGLVLTVRRLRRCRPRRRHGLDPVPPAS